MINVAFRVRVGPLPRSTMTSSRYTAMHEWREDGRTDIKGRCGHGVQGSL